MLAPVAREFTVVPDGLVSSGSRSRGRNSALTSPVSPRYLGSGYDIQRPLPLPYGRVMISRK
jgi:hypothetical protein